MWASILKASLTGITFAGIQVSAAEFPKEVHPPLCNFHHHHEMAKKAATTNRPAADFQMESQLHPLTVHWTTTVTEDYAREILAYAEQTWETEFETKGFMRPHPDGVLGGSASLDIYINTELDPGIGGYAGFSGFVDETPRQDAFGYLVINNNIDPRLRRFVVAHELFHLSQMAYDWWEDISFMEASATWIADHVFDDENIYWRYFPFFNQEPFSAMDFISIRNPYQYGAALFTTYLDERFGGGDTGFVRRVWESSVQDDITNEPDFLDAVAMHLPAGISLADAYHEFGTWRLLTGSRSRFGYFSEGSLWDERMDPWLELDVKMSELPAAATAQKPVGPFAHSFLRLENDALYEGSITGRIKSAGGVFRVSHLTISADGARITTVATIHNQTAVDFSIAVTANESEHFLILTNITDGSYDADTSSWDGVGFIYSFAEE
jgi:hypothetical protein